MRVAPIDVTHADFAANEAVVRRGIEAAALFLDWFIKFDPSAKTTVQPDIGEHATPEIGRD